MVEVKPSQAARDAAAEVVYRQMSGGLSDGTRDRILNGQWDDHPTVQAFARIEASAFAAGRKAGLMEEARKVWAMQTSGRDEFDGGWDAACERIATALEERANAD